MEYFLRIISLCKISNTKLFYNYYKIMQKKKKKYQKFQNVILSGIMSIMCT